MPITPKTGSLFHADPQKIAPKRFGDRLLVAGEAENPVQVLHRQVSVESLSAAQLDELEAFCERMIALQQQG